MSAAAIRSSVERGDPDAILRRMRADTRSDWPLRLLDAMADAAPIELTARELDVARCLSHGMSEELCADALNVTPFTVKTHTKSLRLKLSAKTTLHACCEAIRLGLIA